MAKKKSLFSVAISPRAWTCKHRRNLHRIHCYLSPLNPHLEPHTCKVIIMAAWQSEDKVVISDSEDKKKTQWLQYNYL